MPNLPQAITFIIGTGLIIFGAYFVTYLLARGSRKITKGRGIQVLDRFSLSRDKSIFVISVYDKIYVVAMSGGAITLLDQLDVETAAIYAARGTEPPLPLPKGLGAALSRLGVALRLVKPNHAERSNVSFEEFLQTGHGSSDGSLNNDEEDTSA